MQRFISVLDKATYMPAEFVQKEKEYGLAWRTAFKVELDEVILDIQRRTVLDVNEEE